MITSEEQELLAQVRQTERLPRHIAFIMDGNGRWAKKQNLPRFFGHREGVTSVREIVEAGVDLKIGVMTFYTFSKENWKRPPKEVSALMKLLVSTIRKEVDDLDENNVRLRTIGNLEDLPKAPREELEHAKERLQNNTGLILNLALSYGGRQDILNTVNRCIKNGKKSIDETDFSNALDTSGLIDPDLLIRTSGEHRLSNFLLWQCAYTEIYIVDTFWPDFRKIDLYKAILDYKQRERRFGAISEQLA
ncbi:MAG: isoprenyl transferase [Candidatus Electryonea clarkiae]|nr:isoprenyl transferase [Candidatus Electryonea clarkiae]MDP8287946.1 isoprenyl transferase [Candidatus Electryonea clarkiae]